MGITLVVAIIAIAIAVPSTARAPAPAALTPSTTTAASSTGPLSTLSPCAGRWAHKGEVDIDGLVEKLGLVCAIDGGAGFLEGIEFDESIALITEEGVGRHVNLIYIPDVQKRMTGRGNRCWDLP